MLIIDIAWVGHTRDINEQHPSDGFSFIQLTTSTAITMNRPLTSPRNHQHQHIDTNTTTPATNTDTNTTPPPPPPPIEYLHGVQGFGAVNVSPSTGKRVL